MVKLDFAVTVHSRIQDTVSRDQPDDFNGYVYFFVRLYCTCLGFQTNIVEEYVLWSALLHIFASLKGTQDQKLSSGLKSGQLSLATTCRHRHPMGLPTTLEEYVVELHQRDHNRVFTTVGDAGTHSVQYCHFRVPASDQRRSHG